MYDEELLNMIQYYFNNLGTKYDKESWFLFIMGLITWMRLQNYHCEFHKVVKKTFLDIFPYQEYKDSINYIFKNYSQLELEHQEPFIDIRNIRNDMKKEIKEKEQKEIQDRKINSSYFPQLNNIKSLV